MSPGIWLVPGTRVTVHEILIVERRRGNDVPSNVNHEYVRTRLSCMAVPGTVSFKASLDIKYRYLFSLIYLAVLWWSWQGIYICI